MEDLEAFAARVDSDHTKKVRCSVCKLDRQVRFQIHAGRAREPKPVTYLVISQWLKQEHGIEMNHATIRNHFTAGHEA